METKGIVFRNTQKNVIYKKKKKTQYQVCAIAMQKCMILRMWQYIYIYLRSGGFQINERGFDDVHRP